MTGVIPVRAADPPPAPPRDWGALVRAYVALLHQVELLHEEFVRLFELGYPVDPERFTPDE